MAWRTIVEGQTGNGNVAVPTVKGKAPKCILITGTFTAGVILFRAVPWKDFAPVAANPVMLVCKRSAPGTWSNAGTSAKGYHMLSEKTLGGRPDLYEMELGVVSFTGDIDIYAWY